MHFKNDMEWKCVYDLVYTRGIILDCVLNETIQSVYVCMQQVFLGW